VGCCPGLENGLWARFILFALLTDLEAFHKFGDEIARGLAEFRRFGVLGHKTPASVSVLNYNQHLTNFYFPSLTSHTILMLGWLVIYQVQYKHKN
jgi:hypothetical protein